MNKKTKDTDYLYASGRIKALERGFLPRTTLLRLCEAESVADGIKLLIEVAYLSPDTNVSTVEAEFTRVQQRCYREAGELFADKSMLGFFRARYDYHNVKTILKGIVTGDDYTELLSDCGRVAPERLITAILEDKYSSFPKRLSKATEEAKAMLTQSGDPQIVDGFLDKEQFADMGEIADATAEKYLIDYFRLQVDMQNLRAAVRLARMGAEFGELRKFFIKGGDIPISRLLTEVTPELVVATFTGVYFANVAAVAASALRREQGLAALDKAVDDALTSFIKRGRRVAFGVEVPVSYVAAKENELVVLRTIFAGLKAGLGSERLTEKLRDTYV